MHQIKWVNAATNAKKANEKKQGKGKSQIVQIEKKTIKIQKNELEKLFPVRGKITN